MSSRKAAPTVLRDARGLPLPQPSREYLRSEDVQAFQPPSDMVDGRMPIGVFDSGLGGLTVLRALQARLPGQGFVYLGDNANAPYGPRSADEIFELTCAGVDRLFRRGCDLVVLACNTASAVALRRMQESWVPTERRVLGVLVPMIEAIAGRDWADASPPRPIDVERVALFATDATVRSGAFARELAFRARGVAVTSQACIGLVDAIESGDRVLAARLVDQHCAALLQRCPDPQVAVLGCTHYPLLGKAFVAALPVATRVLSQPEIVAESLADYLRRHPRFAGDGPTGLLTSGDAALVSRQAKMFTGADMAFGQA